MKKIWSILLVVAALFVAVPSQAQFQWGVRGGVNLAKASFSGADLKSDNFTGFFIGPEGGIADEEAAALQNAQIPAVTLGPRILRTETAPLMVLSVLLFASGNLEA